MFKARLQRPSTRRYNRMYKTALAAEQTRPYVVFGSVFPATPVTDAHLVDPIEKKHV